MSTQDILNRLKKTLFWLLRGKFHLLSVFAVILTGLYSTHLLTLYSNAVGALLSMSGLIIILTLQILDAREFADHKPNTLTNWLKSYPRARNTAIAVGATIGAVVFGKARVSVSVAENASIEGKVDFLIRQLNALNAAIANVDDRVDELKSALTTSERSRTSIMDNLSASLNSVIASHIVGAYDINLFGISITICGTLIQFFSA